MILYPFSFLGDFWEILFLSILTSFVVLLAYKYFSSPAKIKRAKNQVKASIFAIRLYKDFWKVILGSFFKSLLYVMKYFALNFGVIIIILPLLVPLFVQMDVRYGMRAFKAGEEIVIKAGFSQDPKSLEIELLESEHFKPKMNPVFIDAFKDEEKKKPLREVNWKVEAAAAGDTKIRIKVDGKIFEKSLLIGEHKGALSNKKLRDSSISHIEYPVEKVFPEAGELEFIYIQYPGRSVSFLGISMHWILYYLLLTLIIVLAFKKRFGIEF